MGVERITVKVTCGIVSTVSFQMSIVLFQSEPSMNRRNLKLYKLLGQLKTEKGRLGGVTNSYIGQELSPGLALLNIDITKFSSSHWSYGCRIHAISMDFLHYYILFFIIPAMKYPFSKIKEDLFMFYVPEKFRNIHCSLFQCVVLSQFFLSFSGWRFVRPGVSKVPSCPTLEFIQWLRFMRQSSPRTNKRTYKVN